MIKYSNDFEIRNRWKQVMQIFESYVHDLFCHALNTRFEKAKMTLDNFSHIPGFCLFVYLFIFLFCFYVSCRSIIFSLCWKYEFIHDITVLLQDINFFKCKFVIIGWIFRPYYLTQKGEWISRISSRYSF